MRKLFTLAVVILLAVSCTTEAPHTVAEIQSRSTADSLPVTSVRCLVREKNTDNWQTMILDDLFDVGDQINIGGTLWIIERRAK